MTRPKLTSAAAVMAPLAPRDPAAIAERARIRGGDDVRAAAFGGRLPEAAGDLTLAQCINAALTEALAAHPEMLVFGEDVGRKGGVYGLTRGLQQRFGAARVFDTLLDEQAILGPGTRPRGQRPAPGAGDPVPGLPAQRRGPAPR